MPAILAGLDAELLAIFGLMLFIVACAFTYQTVTWMQQHAGSLPVIGGPFGGLLENVKSGIRGAAHGAEGWLASAIQNLTNTRVQLTRWIMQNPLNGLHDLLLQVQGWANSIHNDLTNFKNWAFAQVNNLHSEITTLYNSSIGHADALHAQEIAYANQLHAQELAALNQAKATIQLQIDALTSAFHAQVLELSARVAGLEQYSRILSGLAGFESATGREFAGVLGQTTALQGELTNTVGELRTVLPLSVVTALGVDAIENLVRVAKDPCYCLNAGQGAGLEARVAMLELGNL